MLSEWPPPCGNKCTSKYAALTKIPWRVFCKKGCDSDGETWEECLGDCNDLCYKDPVLKDRQWSAFIDRSPGDASYSQECFKACVSGCGYKAFDFPALIVINRFDLFDIDPQKVAEATPDRPLPPVVEKPPPPPPPPVSTTDKPRATTDDVPSCASA